MCTLEKGCSSPRMLHKRVSNSCNGKLLGCRDTYDERFYLNPALVTDAKRSREKSLQSIFFSFLSKQFFSFLYKQCDFSRIVFPIQDMSICSGKQWRWLQLGCLSSLKLEIQVHGSLARGAFPYFLTRARASGGRFRAVCEIPPAFRKQYFTKNFTHFYSIIVIYYIAYFQWWTWHFIKINFFGLVCWDK